MGSRHGRLFSVVALALVALLAAAPAASAKKKKKHPLGPVRTVSASASATGNLQMATATATCPKKTKAVGGGFSESPPGAGFSVIGFVYESQKVGQKQWRASAQLTDPGAPETVTLTTSVYCRKGAKGTTPVSQTANSAGGMAALGPTATATCPVGKKAMSGGFVTPAPFASAVAKNLVMESYRTIPNAWVLNAVTGAAAPSTVTSIADCAKGKLPAATSGAGTPVTVSGTSGSALATCSGKKSAVAGGFSQPGFTTSSFYAVYQSLREGKNWRVTGAKIGASPLSIASNAYCAA